MPEFDMETSEACPLCHEAVDSYAIGDCDHPICYRCSIRMRVLCDQLYCPICRNDLNKVYIVKNIRKFSEIPRHGYIPNRKYKLFFEDDRCLSKFEKLMEHRCPKCKSRHPDRSFKALQDHMRKEHTLYYCNLCVENLKIFSHERKYYNRQELATHRRVGDKNDSSYKGHPLCHFCDERYLDSDELFRHLRKDHYYCHFCETEGSNEYYSDYNELKGHFKACHYLCEDGECGDPQTQFTHAFRDKIDFKAHVTATHTMKFKSKAEARQARTIDVEFQLPPRNRRKDRGVITGGDYEDVSHNNLEERVVRGTRGRGRGQGQGRISQKDRFRDDEIQQAIHASLSVMKETEKTTKSVEEDKTPAQTEDNFPSLGSQIVGAQSQRPDSPADIMNRDSDSDAKSSSMADRIAQVNRMSVQHGRLGMADFPTLHGANVPSSGQLSEPYINNSKTTSKETSKPVTKTVSAKPVPAEDFPQLPSSCKINKPTKSATAWGKKQKLEQSSQPKPSAFPISGGVSVKSDHSQNAEQNQRKTMKMKKPSKNVLNDDAEFPSLSGSTAASSGGGLSWAKMAKEESNKDNKQKTVDWFDIDDNYEFSMVNLKGDKHDKDSLKIVENNSGSKKKNKKKVKDTQLPVKNGSLLDSRNNSSLDNIANALLVSEKIEKKANSLESISNIVSTSSVSESKSQNVLPPRDKSEKQKNSDIESSDEDFLTVEKEKPIPAHLISENIYDKLNTFNKDSGNETYASKNTKKSTKVAFNNEDFPVLGKANKSTAPPPGFQTNGDICCKKSPPGFSEIKPGGGRPPPGFHVSPPNTADTVMEKPILDVDIQKIIPMAVDTIKFTYAQPDNFSSRNQKLISDISVRLEGDQEKFDNFKTWSRDFRSGSMVASEYYDRCQSLLGLDNFDIILSELLVLLPDINKQQELLTAHNKSQIRRKKQKGNVIKISDGSNKEAWGNTQSFFQSCPTCRQVLGPDDYTRHISSVHGNSDMDFPSLHSDTVPSGSVLRAWVKAK